MNDFIGRIYNIEQELKETTSIRLVGKESEGYVRNYYLNSKDLDKLPTLEGLKTGSYALCMDTNEVHFFDESNGSWS